MVEGEVSHIRLGNPQRIVLDLTYLPDGKLAENRRRGIHWSVYAGLLETERNKAFGELARAIQSTKKTPKPMERVAIEFHWSFKRKGPMPDWENLFARTKPLIDILVSKFKLFPDDSPKYIVTSPIHTLEMGCDYDGLRVVINES